MCLQEIVSGIFYAFTFYNEPKQRDSLSAGNFTAALECTVIKVRRFMKDFNLMS